MAIAEQEKGQVRGRSPLLTVALVALLVFAAVIARWLTTPFDDWVPLVAPADLPAEIIVDDLPHAAQFECSAPFGEAEASVATEQAIDALELQALVREPCSEIRSQHRAVGSVNIAVSLGLLGVSVVVWRRRGDKTA